MTRRQGKRFAIALLAALATIGVALVGASGAARADETSIQGGNGGTYFGEQCDAGSYLVGFQVRTGDLIDQIAPQCAQLEQSGKLDLPPKTLGAHGGNGGNDPTVYGCNNDHMIVGAFYVIPTRDSSRTIDNIRFYCFLATNFTQSIFSTDILSGDDAYDENGTGSLYVACPGGEAPTGLTGKASDIVNGLGVFCGPSPAALIASGGAGPPPPTQPQFPAPTFGPRLATKTTTDALSVYLNMIQGSGEGFTDLNNVPWAPAARAAQSICYYNGYAGGFFTGQETIGGTNKYGLVCSGSVIHAPIDGDIFGGVATSGRFETTFAATESCTAGLVLVAALGGATTLPGRGFAVASGSYHDAGGRLDMICFVEGQNAAAFEETDADLMSSGALTNPGLKNTAWAVVARAADILCRRKGARYVGGFFDGVEAAGTHELACVGKPPSFLDTVTAAEANSKLSTIANSGADRDPSGVWHRLAATLAPQAATSTPTVTIKLHAVPTPIVPLAPPVSQANNSASVTAPLPPSIAPAPAGASGALPSSKLHIDSKVAGNIIRDSGADTSGPWLGNWRSRTAAGTAYSITFTQAGPNKLHGTYAPNNGQIDGQVSGATLSFTWTEDASGGGRYGGTGQFSLTAANQQFTGAWNSTTPKPGQGEWDGCRPRVKCPF